MKVILLLIIIILPASTAFAQLSVGLKGGLNMVNVYVGSQPDDGLNPSFDNQYQLAYHGGIYGRYSISEKLAIHSELLYSNK